MCGQCSTIVRWRWAANSMAYVALFFLLVGSGCRASSVNKAQFDRMRLGMTPAEVEDILGKGTAVDAAEAQRLIKESMTPVDPAADGGGLSAFQIDVSELRGLRFGSEKKFITVIFRNDRLFRIFQQGL